MARTTKDFVFGQYPQGLENMVYEFLISEGYKLKDKKGERVYQKGAGLMMGPTFIKLTLMGNGARLEGWQMSAILPGVYAGEIDIESFVGVAVKGPLKKRFRTIEEMIMRFGGMPAFPGVTANMGYPPQMQGGYPQMMQNGYQPAPQQPQMPQAQPQMPQAQPQMPQRSGRICKFCGASSPDGMNFCMNCGNKLE